MDSGEAPEPERTRATGASSDAGDEQFVWPWMGVLTNVPTQWRDSWMWRDGYEWRGGIQVGQTESSLMEQLSHFYPHNVIPLFDQAGHTGSAIVLFGQDFACLGNALAFENHFEAQGRGKQCWQEYSCGYRRLPKQMFGWVARADDRSTPGLIGEYLRRHGGLKTIAQLESEMQNLARLLGTMKNLDKEKKMLQQKPDATQNLEFEIKQLKEVMKQKDSESKMKIDELTEVIQEKDAAIKYMESQHGILVTRDLMSNDELQDARKELIRGLGDVTSGQTSIGIKRMGDLDSKSFVNACKHKMSDIEATLLCSEWEDDIKNPHWHPFRVGPDDGKGKHENIEENKKLTTTKCHQPRGNILVSAK